MLPNLYDYREEFLRSFNGAYNTLQLYKHSTDLMIKCLGKKFMLHELNRSDIDKFHGFLDVRYPSPNSVHKFLSHLRTVWKKYWDTYITTIYDIDPKYVLTRQNYFKRVIKTKLPTTKSKILLSSYEFSKLVTAVLRLNIPDAAQLCDMLYIYRFLGLRRNEALLLKAEDIKENHVVITEEKDGVGSTRIVPLFDEARDILEARTDNIQPNQNVFNYSYFNVWKHTKDAVYQAELNPKITVQSLRVTFGSSLILQNIPISKVSQWLGHNSVQMTERFYSDLIDRDHQYWIDRVADDKTSNYKVIA